MPRSGPRRQLVNIRLAPGGIEAVARLAAIETDGNMSEMIRKLLSEALATRERKSRD
jgi:hypothetical protein